MTDKMKRFFNNLDLGHEENFMEEADQNLVKAVRGKHESPIIGIIGSSLPDYNYTAQVGVASGYIISEYCHKNNGSIFTGGVSGVGADVFTGVSLYCSKFKKKDSKFFVLIPEKTILNEFHQNENKEMEEISFNLPKSYQIISQLTDTKITEERTGRFLSDRRLYVAEVADILVAINGGYGTLDEAILALRKNKPVLVLYGSGGAAGALYKAKFKLRQLEKQFDHLFIKPLSEQERNLIIPVENLSSLSTIIEFVNRDLKNGNYIFNKPSV